MADCKLITYVNMLPKPYTLEKKKSIELGPPQVNPKCYHKSKTTELLSMSHYNMNASSTSTQEEAFQLNITRSKSTCTTIDISYLLQERESCSQYFINAPAKKVVIFDLDETLIYNSSREFPQQAPIIFPRPYYYDLFVKVSEFYDIWVWSASERHYIDSVLKNMDPYKTYVKRVLSRNDCTLSREGYLIKDVGRFLNLDLSQVIIVDNNAASFILNAENGILVSSFNGNFNDIELLNVIGLLLSARNDKDVRLALRVYRV